MFKNRDTDCLDNSVRFFNGSIYNFIGLINSKSKGGEVWIGTNSVGFSIMNTSSYNIKDDDIPVSDMEKEGELMYKALGVCASLEEFEKFLNGTKKPYGVQANFGVIDARGGAAYYEVNNYKWIKYDVNKIECGYKVVTNFSDSGRPEDIKGYERYLSASKAMSELSKDQDNGKIYIGPHDLFYKLSRSYDNQFIGIDYLNDYSSLKKDYGFTGAVPDQDFIPRRITSSAVVIEGVNPGENPLHTVMWTLLGYPCCTVSVPLLVADSDIIPSYMKESFETNTAWMCDMSLKIKDKYVFKYNTSNGKDYVDIPNILNLLHECLVVESNIESSWTQIYNLWVDGDMDFSSFKEKYAIFTESYFERYTEHFSPFLY